MNNLCDEIRQSIIEYTSENGGFLSSNLASVEIITALNYLLSNEDELIVIGHDQYTNNILNGRYNDMNYHKYDSLADAFSNNINRDLSNSDRNIFIYIGSDSMNNPYNLEMLKYISSYDNRIIVIYNEYCDEKRSVNLLRRSVSTIGNSKSYNNFKKSIKNVLREMKNGEDIIESIHKTKSNIKKNLFNEGIFEEFDIDYIGPIDGHSISSILFNLKSALTKDYPVVVHCASILNKDLPDKYQKLKNYRYVEPFNIKDGRRLMEENDSFLYARNIVSRNLSKMMKEDNNLICVSDDKYSQYSLGSIKAEYPDRFFNMNVSVYNLLEFVKGLSENRKIYIPIKSSQLLQCIDVLKNSISKLNRPLLIGVLNDSNTDERIYELLSDLNIYVCKDCDDIRNIMYSAFSYNSPVLFLYPDSCIYYKENNENIHIELGKWQKIVNNDMKDKCVLTYGQDCGVLKNLIENNDLICDLYNMSFINPFDYEMLERVLNEYKTVYVYNGIVKDRIENYYNKGNFKAKLVFIGKDELNTLSE